MHVALHEKNVDLTMRRHSTTLASVNAIVLSTSQFVDHYG